MKKTIVRILAAAMMLLLLVGTAACSAPQSPNGSYAGGDYYNPGAGDKMEGVEDSVNGGSAADISLPENRVIIKTVYETVETLEYDSFLDLLQAEVAAHDGYFSSSQYRDNSYGYTSTRSAEFVIRVPADKLSAFCSRVDGIGHVTSFQEQIDDVTLSYVAIESRIEVLESEESALLTMLSRAETVSDMLAIRKQLENVQEELAALRAQKRTYDDQVAYSTVNMTVREVKRVSESVDKMTFGEELGHTFMNSLYGIGDFFRALAIFVGGNSPTLLLIALLVTGVALLLRHLVRRERAKYKKTDKTE